LQANKICHVQVMADSIANDVLAHREAVRPPARLSEALTAELTCSICQEFFSSPVMLHACGHTVDRECAAKAYASGCFSRCCICQASVENPDELFKAASNRELLALVSTVLSDEPIDGKDDTEQHQSRVRDAEAQRLLRIEHGTIITPPCGHETSQTIPYDHTPLHLIPFGVAFVAVPFVLCFLYPPHGMRLLEAFSINLWQRDWDWFYVISLATLGPIDALLFWF